MTQTPAAGPSYRLTILTLNYVISGQVAFDTELTFSDADPWFQLTGVELQHVHRAVPSDSLMQFSVPCGGRAFALLPQKEPRQMRRYQVWQEYKRPLKARFYAGTYEIVGTAALVRDNYLEPELPVYDVQVTSRSTKRYLEFTAPFALLNRQAVDGFRIG